MASPWLCLCVLPGLAACGRVRFDSVPDGHADSRSVDASGPWAGFQQEIQDGIVAGSTGSPTVSTAGTLPTAPNCVGGVLAPSGYLYCIPFDIPTSYEVNPADLGANTAF